MMVSVFNPAAWLDTVLVIGTVGATLPPPVQVSFASGAVAASLLWFAIWVFGARVGRRLMTSAAAWRMLDGGVAVAMIAMAAFVALELVRS
jgi:L-lysine exporter family protein LysE/ArgO